MLTAHRIPKTCHSCRLHLLSLFEYGFTAPIVTNATRTRQRALKASQPRRHLAIRTFSTTVRSLTANQSNEQSKLDAQHEVVVRQARQTFGETLPKDYLSAEEYVVYERLFGPPVRETKPEDLEYLPTGDEETEEGKVRNVLLRQNENGEYEEIEFDPKLGFSVLEEGTTYGAEAAAGMEGEALSEASEALTLEEKLGAAQDVDNGNDPDKLQVLGKNQREVDVIARLQKDMDEALAQPIEEEEEFDEEFEEEDEEIEEDEEDFEEDEGNYISSDEIRTHPHTMIGRFGTKPSTLSLPQEQLIAPVTELLERTNFKHLRDAAERAFGGVGLPNSSLTRGARKQLPQKHIGLDASQHKMTEMEADSYIAGVMPGTYASVMSTLVEVRKRLGSQWLRDIIFREGGEGPRILDAGAGGVGAVAWREIIQAEWDTLRDEGIVEGEQAPSGKTSVLVGSSTLRHRASTFLDNTTFLPRLPDYIHSSSSEALLDGGAAQPRKSYDIIIAPHLMLPLKEDWRRKNIVQNLWSLLDPKGGVLILIEKGIPRGFEAIAGARSLLLDTHISSPGETATENEIQAPTSDGSRFQNKEEGMIIAPCTNHTGCPMYPVPGLSSGRKDFCHFGQRFLRPAYLQRILGAKARNHEDVKFSYIAVRRGIDARRNVENPILQGEGATRQAFEGYETDDLPESTEPFEQQEASDIKFNALSLPRLILPSLKRRGHTTLDLCTPAGKLERWTVPKSFSTQAHRDARKSQWGDLWALGAKTRVPRSPRLGRLAEDGGKKKGIRDGRVGKGGKKVKKNKFEIIMGEDGMEGIKQVASQTKFVKREKRTKGGRIWKEPKPIGEDDL